MRTGCRCNVNYEYFQALSQWPNAGSIQYSTVPCIALVLMYTTPTVGCEPNIAQRCKVVNFPTAFCPMFIHDTMSIRCTTLVQSWSNVHCSTFGYVTLVHQWKVANSSTVDCATLMQWSNFSTMYTCQWFVVLYKHNVGPTYSLAQQICFLRHLAKYVSNCLILL